ncbi:MAG: AAA domain-containing protein [Candidatus Xenobiia bacterium LiM19]
MNSDAELALPSAMSLIPLFQQALSDEIDSHLQKGASRYVVRDGRQIRHHRRIYIYEFQVDDIIRAMDDAPITMKIDDKTYKGSLISTTGFRVTVELEQDCGDTISHALLITSAEFLLERLIDSLEAMKRGRKGVNWESVEKLFGRADIIAGKEAAYRLTPGEAAGKTNYSQRKAIAVAAGSDITFVWGPPGTGKTSTLGLMVDAFLNAGLRILVASNTNVAVDMALMKIAEASRGTSRIERGKVVRFGTPAMKEPEELTIIEKTTVDHIVSVRTRGDSERLAMHEKRISELEHYIEAIRRLKENEILYKKFHGQYERAMQRWKSAKAKEKAFESELKNHIFELSRKKAEWYKHVEEGAPLRCFPSGERYASRRISCEDRCGLIKLKEYSDRVHDCKHARNMAALHLEVTGEKRTQLKEELKAVFRDFSNPDTVEAEIRKELTCVKKQCDEIRERINAAGREIVRKAEVIATTLSQCYLSSEISELNYDVLIIDEGSMAPLPMIFHAASLCRYKVVIAGDFRQLPPIAKSDSDAALMWLKRDIYSFLSAEKPNKLNNTVLLDTQYRMHPLIASVANELVYHGEIRDGIPPFKRSFHRLLGVLSVVDTGELQARCLRTENHSRFNILHAVLCILISDRLAVEGLDQGELGIIAPYRAQARLLSRLLIDAAKEITSCATVHRFQGRERNAIIFDTTGSSLAGSGKLLRGDVDSEGGKVMNVAMTRPKDLLTVIAGVTGARRKSPTESFLVQVMEYIEKKGRLLKAYDVVPETLGNVMRGIESRNRFMAGSLHIELFTEDSMNSAIKSLFNSAQVRRMLLLPKLSGIHRVVFDLLAEPSAQGDVTSMIITGKRPDSLVRQELRAQGIKIAEAYVTNLLVLCDSDKLLIPRIGRCTNGKSLGIAMYQAAGTVEELLKLMGLHEIVTEFEDESIPSAALSSKYLSRACPQCHATLKVAAGLYGPYIGCSERDCSYREKLTDDQILFLLPKAAKICKYGHKMEIRRVQMGERAGTPFLCCSQFPACRDAKSLSRSMR